MCLCEIELLKCVQVIIRQVGQTRDIDIGWVVFKVAKSIILHYLMRHNIATIILAFSFKLQGWFIELLSGYTIDIITG